MRISTIIFEILAAIFAILAAYSFYGIGHFHVGKFALHNPKADFLISGAVTKNAPTLIYFTTYECGYCKDIAPIMAELKDIRQDIRVITYPIASFGSENERLTKIVMAAGLQGRFQEMHDALMEHPQYIVTDVFIEETATLYGLDYDQLVRDADSKRVEKLIKQANKALEYTGIGSVPSFMVGNTGYYVGDNNFPDLKDLLLLTLENETP